MNLILFYAPLDKQYPHFFFKIRMSLRQIIEGIIGLLYCLLSNLIKDDNEKKKKNKYLYWFLFSNYGF